MIQLRGYHFHNKGYDSFSFAYVRDTLIKNLLEKNVKLPGKDGVETEIPIKDLGIGYPVIASELGRPHEVTIDDPDARGRQGRRQERQARRRARGPQKDRQALRLHAAIFLAAQAAGEATGNRSRASEGQGRRRARRGSSRQSLVQFDEPNDGST